MVGIYLTNCVNLKEFDKIRGRDIGTAVFASISRINHSCSPNTVLSYNIDAKQCEVRSSRTIQCGEELTRSYINPLNSKKERESLLQVYLHFFMHLLHIKHHSDNFLGQVQFHLRMLRVLLG